MRTRWFLAEENLFLLQCITSCGSTEPTDYTLDICQAIPRRMVVSACQNSTRLRSSIQSVSELRSLYSAGRRSAVIGANRNLRFCDETIDLPTHASAHVLIRALLRHRHSGDGGEIINYCIPAGSAIRASRFWPPRKIDEIPQDIQRLIALGVDGRFFGVIRSEEHTSEL